MSVRAPKMLSIGWALSALAIIALAAGCGPNTGEPLQATPAPSLTAPAPAAASPAAASSPTPPPAGSTAGLVVSTRELAGQPGLDPLSATTIQGAAISSESMRIGPPFEYQWLADSPGMWAMLGDSKLVASEQYSNDGMQGWVSVTRDGEEIYRIETGKASPMAAIQGFFVADGHWVLETNNYTDEEPFGGKITVDGVLLNEQEGYEKAFNAQTIAGKLFYLFQRDGKIDAWYDGQVISLGYEDVPHYACCSGGEMNPYKGQDAVSFFAVRQGTWYLVEIGTPSVVAP